ncbi:hypothetical protein [Viridibacillus arvi]|uniref:hypothetical protein n=1 Tax=Viridibacillus arvi TaxID=263475 RepID=UPI0034D00A03
MKFIILFILSLLIAPLSRNGFKVKVGIFNRLFKTKINTAWIELLAVFWLFVLVYEYILLIDDNISSILYYLVPLALFIALSGLFLYLDQGSKLGKSEKWIKYSLSITFLLMAIFFGPINVLISQQAKYDSVVVEYKESAEVFTEEDTPFLVPKITAANKMKKVFGNVPNVSYYELGEITPQWVNGEAIYVAPIEITGLIKAFKSDKIPAYIIMSGTNPSAEAELKLGYSMKYVPSEIGKHNLKRKIRQAEPNLIFYGEPKFEIDDEGKPFYTWTYGDFVQIRSGFIPKGVVVADPQTGEVEKYVTGEEPEFIDATINGEVSSTLEIYFGKFVEGLFNFSQTNVKLPNSAVTPIFDKEGRMYYFTDYSSPKEGVDAALGYSLLDAKTGKINYYSGKDLQGMMDSNAAKIAVNNKFKREVWKGTMPVVYNVYGTPSWVLPVVDSAGLVQSYAIVSATNANVFASAPTHSGAFKKYKSALTKKTATLTPSSKGEEKSINGKVTVKKIFQEEENKMVYLMLDGYDEIFVIIADDFPYSIFVQEGDTVSMNYLDSGELAVAVTNYQNAKSKK